MKQTVKPELNNPEMKSKYIAQHWGQHVLVLGDIDFVYPIWTRWIDTAMNSAYRNETHLLLTHLDQVSDEDLTEAVMINWPMYRGKVVDLNWAMRIIETISNSIAVYQFLQSKGYALPWNGHSVKELIEAGYCQLRKGGGDE